jgi:hypothetical protein
MRIRMSKTTPPADAETAFPAFLCMEDAAFASLLKLLSPFPTEWRACVVGLMSWCIWRGPTCHVGRCYERKTWRAWIYDIVWVTETLA